MLILQQFSPKKYFLIYSLLSHLQKNIFPAIFVAHLRQKTREAGRTPARA